jgi:hypothetical protein
MGFASKGIEDYLRSSIYFGTLPESLFSGTNLVGVG